MSKDYSYKKKKLKPMAKKAALDNFYMIKEAMSYEEKEDLRRRKRSGRIIGGAYAGGMGGGIYALARYGPMAPPVFILPGMALGALAGMGYDHIQSPKG